MKRITLLFLSIFTIVSVKAQNYQISYTGIIGTGTSVTVDSVKVENLTQCANISISGIDTLHLVGTAGITELNIGADNALNIYPNPMTGNCLVSFNATVQGNTTIKLYDISGKIILQVQELLSKGHQTFKLSGISSGVYLLRIESDIYSYSGKIISNNAILGKAEIKNIGTTNNIDYLSDNVKNSKSSKSIIDMPYTTGDILKFTGFSGGVYKTVSMLVPTQSQTITFNFVACADADSNYYAVVKIGTQIWMAENLRTTKYNNGNRILNVTNDNTWDNLVKSAYCWFDNDSITYASLYGALYNCYAVDTGLIAPAGWHVATVEEWTTLNDYLGGPKAAGGKLKEACSTHWDAPNTGATNESGFTALPGGNRDEDGLFEFIMNGNWWSYTASDSKYYWSVYSQNPGLIMDNSPMSRGFSIRCVKD